MGFDCQSHSLADSGSVFSESGEAFSKTVSLLVCVKHIHPTPEDKHSALTEPMSTCNLFILLRHKPLWISNPHMPTSYALCSQIGSSFSYGVYCKKLTLDHIIPQLIP